MTPPARRSPPAPPPRAARPAPPAPPPPSREPAPNRAPGLSARAKLALSYAAFLMVGGTVLILAVVVFYLYFLPSGFIHTGDGSFFINRSLLTRSFMPYMAFALFFLLVFGLLGGWLLAGRMLAPLTRITAATRAAANGSLSHRIRLPGRQDEFRELADAFDTMLTRLEAHVAEQRRFAANASHELRTPLAITRAMLDVARTDPGHDSGELVERLHTVNTRAIDLTQALLLLSRADRRLMTRERVDLSLLAEEAAEDLLPLAEKRGVALRVLGMPARAVGSPALLAQLITNLVHNAIVHNLPQHGFVQVGTSVRADSVLLTVENTGERLDPRLVATLTEPFQRGTERARGRRGIPAGDDGGGLGGSADHVGAGLGLAIVKRITEAHDGRLTLAARNGGGLCVMVRLPMTARGIRRPRRISS